jgi:hypothetical protein
MASCAAMHECADSKARSGPHAIGCRCEHLKDIAFKPRFEEKYPDTRFATHMMPYAYDSVHMIVRALETGKNPAVYLRDLRSYDIVGCCWSWIPVNISSTHVPS